METQTPMNQISTAAIDTPTPGPLIDADALQRVGDDLRRAVDALGDGGADGSDAVPGFEPPAAEAPAASGDALLDLEDDFSRARPNNMRLRPGE